MKSDLTNKQWQSRFFIALTMTFINLSFLAGVLIARNYFGVSMPEKLEVTFFFSLFLVMPGIAMWWIQKNKM